MIEQHERYTRAKDFSQRARDLRYPEWYWAVADDCDGHTALSEVAKSASVPIELVTQVVAEFVNQGLLQPSVMTWREFSAPSALDAPTPSWSGPTSAPLPPVAAIDAPSTIPEPEPAAMPLAAPEPALPEAPVAQTPVPEPQQRWPSPATSTASVVSVADAARRAVLARLKLEGLSAARSIAASISPPLAPTPAPAPLTPAPVTPAPATPAATVVPAVPEPPPPRNDELSFALGAEVVADSSDGVMDFAIGQLPQAEKEPR